MVPYNRAYCMVGARPRMFTLVIHISVGWMVVTHMEIAYKADSHKDGYCEELYGGGRGMSVIPASRKLKQRNGSSGPVWMTWCSGLYVCVRACTVTAGVQLNR